MRCDLVQSGLHAVRIGEVRADAHGLAAARVDFLDNSLIAGRITGQKNHGVGFGKLSGDGGALCCC